MQTRDALSVTRSSITGQSAQKHFEHLHANRKDLRSAPPPASQPARPYRGYYYDTETGLYYLQSRYYDPEAGRFINADAFASTGQGILAANMFAYCWNNPVNHVDYDGGLPKWVGIIAGAAAGIAVAAATVALAPAAMCAVTFALTWYGVGYTTAAAISAIGVSAIAANATIYAMDAGYSAATNESPVLNIMGNNTAAYNTWRAVTEFSMYGYVAAARQGMLWSVCFVSGTLIDAESGLTPIESIKKGDLVWSWDEETGRVELKPVVETYINECNELIHLTFGDEEILCTPNHPFYVPQKGWTAAVHLRAGDILVTVNGEYVVLEKVQHELLEAPVTVYNFQVEGYHTYHVGESGIRVHNANCHGWGAGGKGSPEVSLEEHFYKHGDEVGAYTPAAYYQKAQYFAIQVLKKGIKGKPIDGYTPNTYRYYYNRKYIDLAWRNGEYSIISFGGQ